jgi:hypothetical protein
MNYYKISLEVGKKKSLSRVIFVKRATITEALDVSKKIYEGKLTAITTISQKEYFEGLDKKYNADPRDGIQYT